MDSPASASPTIATILAETTTSYDPSSIFSEDFYSEDSGELVSMPWDLPLDVSSYPKLSAEQAGHLRHFHNLASQPDGEWALMGSQEPAQEWLDAYRYQLATMAYAAGSVHYHRIPAVRSPFKKLIKKLIAKMLRRETWGYWYLTSQSGIKTDPDLKELRRPWADPVCKENIMYSGHLLLMVSLYAMLFDDDAYEKEGSITFDWNPVFWGLGPERFQYSRSSLQDAIIKEMKSTGWLGACCEPNLVFIVCNQFPLIAMRYNDARYGTNVLEGVLSQYKLAWAKKGMVTDKGLFPDRYLVKQDVLVSSIDISFTAWACAWMPWNFTDVSRMYKSMSTGFFDRCENRININPPGLAYVIKDALAQGKKSPSPEIIRDIKEKSLTQTSARKFPYSKPAFGYIAQWISEVGNPEDLQGLLNHADFIFESKWLNDGLYYVRNDIPYDENGNYTHVDPFTGNAAIGYARLNVPGGQKRMWDDPWTKRHFETEPKVDGINLEEVDVLRGSWAKDKNALIMTFRSVFNRKVVIYPRLKNMPPGVYAVYRNGRLIPKLVKMSQDPFTIGQEFTGEMDLVLLKIGEHNAEA